MRCNGMDRERILIQAKRGHQGHGVQCTYHRCTYVGEVVRVDELYHMTEEGRVESVECGEWSVQSVETGPANSKRTI